MSTTARPIIHRQMEKSKQEKEGGKAGDQIPNTPNTYASSTPATPSEECTLMEKDITPTLEDWIEALNHAAADTLEGVSANCKKRLHEKANMEPN